MRYFQTIQAIKNEEINSNPAAKFLLSKVFAECCTGWANRSRVYSFATKQEALNEAINLIGDYDLSTTEYYSADFAEIETGDPAMDAAIADLAKHHRITLGDFQIEIDDLER